MAFQWLLIFIALLVVLYGARGMWSGAKERVESKEWIRLGVGGAALVVVIVALLMIE